MADVDAAITAAQQPESVEMVKLDGHLPSGRPFSIAVPVDLAPSEALALTKAVADLPARLAAQRAKPRLVLASRIPVA